VCACVCVCVCMCVCICVCVCVCECARAHVCLIVCARIHTCGTTSVEAFCVPVFIPAENPDGVDEEGVTLKSKCASRIAWSCVERANNLECVRVLAFVCVCVSRKCVRVSTCLYQNYIHTLSHTHTPTNIYTHKHKHTLAHTDTHVH